MIVGEISVFIGPSVWSVQPVVRALLSRPASPNAATRRNLVADARQALVALPSISRVPPHELIENDLPHGFAGTVAFVALNLQRLAGISVDFSCAEGVAFERDTIVVEIRDHFLGRTAIQLAIKFVELLVQGTYISSFEEEWRRFNILASSRLPDLPTESIINAAKCRGIPVQNDDPRGRFFDLGNGPYRQRVLGSIPSTTSAIGERIAQDKRLTNHILRNAGIPVPDGDVVRGSTEAVKIANALGYPVVVKPVDGGGSAGVSLDLRSALQVEQAVPSARDASLSGIVLVEQFISGSRFRAVVVNERLSSVIEHLGAFVVGDGRHTVNQLIDIANTNDRRGQRPSDPLMPIVKDVELPERLHDQKLTLSSIPQSGQKVILKDRARRGDGGYSRDVTKEIHPENAALLIQACRAVGLDLAAIDLVAPSISISIRTGGGAIVDINTGAAFSSELNPAEGQPRDPGPAIVDMLFPPGQPVRAPIVAVIGDSSHDVCEQIASELGATGKTVGLATVARLVVGGMELRGIVRPGAAGIRTILNNPAVEIAVAEVTAVSIIEEGLGFNYCDVAIVLSLSGLQTPFGQPVESVVTGLLDDSGVLVVVADDPAAQTLAAETSAQRVTIDRDSNQDWIDEIVTTVRRHLPL